MLTINLTGRVKRQEKNKVIIAWTIITLLVRETGLEPVRWKPHAPQTCASASSATAASIIAVSLSSRALCHATTFDIILIISELSIAFLKKYIFFWKSKNRWVFRRFRLNKRWKQKRKGTTYAKSCVHFENKKALVLLLAVLMMASNHRNASPSVSQ